MAGAVMAAGRVMAAALLTSFPAGAARLPASCPLAVRSGRSAAAQEEEAPAVEEAAAAAVVPAVVVAGQSAAGRVMAVPLLTPFPAAAAARRLPASCPWTARSVRSAAEAEAAAVAAVAAVPVAEVVAVAVVAEEAAVAGTAAGAGVAQSAAGLFCTLFPSPEALARRGRP